MKRIVAMLIMTSVLAVLFVLPANALSQSISGEANNSKAVFYVTVSDSDMSSCEGSFSVSGGTITSIGLAGNGSISVNGNSYVYTGGTPATIRVVCQMSGNSAILTSKDAIIRDGQNRVVGIADGVTSNPVSLPTTTTTTKSTITTTTVEDKTTTTTTTEENTTEEETSEEETTDGKTTTTTTTEIVIAPTKANTQNGNGNGIGAKLVVLLIGVIAVLLLAFAVGILLGKHRSESLTYDSDETVKDILGDIEDRFDQSADD